MVKCGAVFDVASEIRIAVAKETLSLDHPAGHYKCRLKDGKPNKDGKIEILQLQIFFDAPTVQEAQDPALNHLIEVINILTVVTGCKFEFRRLRHIVDLTPNIGMRDCLVYTNNDMPEVMQPHLSDDLMPTAAKLLDCSPSEQVYGAMRWFRLGVGADNIEEQFLNFWLALELAATNDKPKGKVNDLCPVCRGNLYCETCKTHPVHRPYDKQAIEAMVVKLRPKLADLFTHLYKARNTLLHGDRLESVADQMPCPLDRLIDILAALARDAILNELSQTFLKKFSGAQIKFLIVDRYARGRVGAAAHIQTTCPNGPDGLPDIDKFNPPTIQFTVD